MPARPDFLTNSMIIGAHPDDEMLWFNAIVVIAHPLRFPASAVRC